MKVISRFKKACTMMMTSSFQNKSVEAEKALNQLFGTDYNVKDEMQIIQVLERCRNIRPHNTLLRNSQRPKCYQTELHEN